MNRAVLTLAFVMAASPVFAQTGPAADPHAGHELETQAQKHTK